MAHATTKAETNGFRTALSRHKGAIGLAALPVLVLLWWLFRPEKLFINEHVSEPAPFATPASDHIEYLGKLEAAEPSIASGRVSVVRLANGDRIARIPAFAMGSYTAALSSAPVSNLKLGAELGNGVPVLELKTTSSSSPGAPALDLAVPSNAKAADFSTLIVFRSSDRVVVARAALEPF